MELYKNILCTLLQNNAVEVHFPDLELSTDFFGTVCYRTLQKIKAVIEDDTINDPTCFLKIEEIMQIFEELCGKLPKRHDFG